MKQHTKKTVSRILSRKWMKSRFTSFSFCARMLSVEGDFNWFDVGDEEDEDEEEDDDDEHKVWLDVGEDNDANLGDAVEAVGGEAAWLDEASIIVTPFNWVDE